MGNIYLRLVVSGPYVISQDLVYVYVVLSYFISIRYEKNKQNT